MKIEQIAIEKLKPNERNPRINDNAVDAVARSIQSYGFNNPIITDGDLNIAAGHTRLKAAMKLELKTVPVIRIQGLTGSKFTGFAIADNKTADIANWNEELLGEIVWELNEDADFDISSLGFDDSELTSILDSVMSDDGLTDPDDVPEPPKVAKTKLGDLYQLGNHRLLCGDATKAEDVERLMDGHKADMVFTDPPYNVNYGDSTNPRYTAHVSGKHKRIENDNQSAEDWIEFNNKLADLFKNHCTGDIYVWGAPGPDGMRQRLTFYDNGLHWSATIIWKKNRLVLAAGKYQRIYEPCFYGWHKGSSFRGDRTQVELWECDRLTKSDLHPTMKPVQLCMRGIANSCDTDDMVMDVFLGSGSTMIACEQLGRKCYGMEIAPEYVDVCVERWEKFTGKKALLIDRIEAQDDSTRMK